MQDLSGRLARLEGMVLEMASQLMPILAGICSSPKPSVQIEPMQEEPALTIFVATETGSQGQGERTVPKRWWSKLWSF